MDSIELFPTNKMTFTQKIIVTVRLVLILSIIGYLLTNNSTYIWMGVLTSLSLGGMYYYREYVEKQQNDGETESFVSIETKDQLNKVLTDTYSLGTKENPLSNVLMTEYTDNPTRSPAPPTFTASGIDTVNTNVKRAVQSLNPTIDNTSQQLFGGLYNQFELSNSNRAFFSNPNTKIPNDQGAFANFLYGNMPSCKEDGIQCVKDNGRYNLY
jgi:hypothetical protein